MIGGALYNDAQGLTALKQAARTDTQSPEVLKKVAAEFEALFLQMALKSMRDASLGDELTSGGQVGFYQEMFDAQIASFMARSRGIGFGDAVARSLGPVTGSDAKDSSRPETLAMPERGGEARAASVQASSPSLPPPERARYPDRFGPPGIVAETPTVAQPAAEAPVPAAIKEESVTHEGLLEHIWPAVQRAADRLGVPGVAIAAQAMLESAWGKAVPSDASGRSSHNLFGIKAGSSWEGPRVHVSTLEYESGIPVRKMQTFRAYDSFEESINDYAQLIEGMGRYDHVRGSADVASFARALKQGGYATDPHYDEKIMGVAGSRTFDRALKLIHAAPTQNERS